MGEPLTYPKGRIAVEGGELQDCYDISGSITDGKKTVSTMRGGGMASGVVSGSKSASITFKSAISKEGFERDYLGKHQRDETVQARFKFPGKTITVNGQWTNPTWASNIDGFIDFTITIIGSYTLS